jgi:drug/metabolite transporter (DMT)-like permease
MLNFAVYSACLRLRPAIHWLSLTYVVGVIATLAPMPLFAWEHAAGFQFRVTPATVIAALYMATFPSIVAFVCWNRGVELIGATRASPFLHLVALYSAILATSFLGERLMAFHIVGFALIVGGVALAARKS